MKQYLSLFAVGLILMISSLTVNADNGEKVFPYEYTTETLENGLKVILMPMESNGLLSYYTVVRTGSRDEWEKGKSGFAHFFEHMMFRGTKRHPGAVYDSIIISLGADANAYTTDDYTCYHLNIASEDLETVMDLESDRFQFLDYPEAAFKTESGAVYGEFRKGRTQPFNVLWEKLKETAFDKHTYQHTTIGYEEDIANMPNMFEYSKSFYARYYRPQNCVLMVCGDFDKAKTMEMIRQYYSSWTPEGYTEPKIESEPKQNGERKAIANYPGKTNPILAIGYKGQAYDPASKSVIATQLLGDLAFGSNSDLYKKLMLKESKVQYLGPSFDNNRDPFLWLTYAVVNDVADIDYVRDEINATIKYFQENLVDEERLNNLKKRIKYGFLMGLDTPDKVAGGLARTIALTGGVEAVDIEFATLKTITPQDIQDAAKLLVPEIRTEIRLLGGE